MLPLANMFALSARNRMHIAPLHGWNAWSMTIGRMRSVYLMLITTYVVSANNIIMRSISCSLLFSLCYLILLFGQYQWHWPPNQVTNHFFCFATLPNTFVKLPLEVSHLKVRLTKCPNGLSSLLHWWGKLTKKGLLTTPIQTLYTCSMFSQKIKQLPVHFFIYFVRDRIANHLTQIWTLDFFIFFGEKSASENLAK